MAGERAGTRAIRLTGPTLLVVTMLLSALTLLLGYANKERCVGPTFDEYGRSEPDWVLRANGEVCYSDIQMLWIGRDVDQHVFPYVHGGYNAADKQLYGGALEYPVLTGLVIWLAALPADNDGEFLAWSALLLLACGLLVAFLLCRLSGIRAWWWALAPPVVLYAFHNWDLLAVACVVGAFAAAAAHRRQPPGSTGWRSQRWLMLAAVLLGVGGGFKLYPLMFCLPLALWVVFGRRSGGEITDLSGAPVSTAHRWIAGLWVMALAGGVYAAVNVPFILAGFDGWWASFQFQWSRPTDATTNSIWFWGARPDSEPDNDAVQHQLAMLSTITTAAGLLIAALAGWWRAQRDGEYPWLQVCAVMLCAYLLLNKVHSPQYVLWLLPFFVVLRIRAGWILAYFVADAAVGIGFFKWQYLLFMSAPNGVYDDWPLQAIMIGVWGRAGLLIGLAVAFLLSTAAVPDKAVPARSVPMRVRRSATGDPDR